MPMMANQKLADIPVKSADVPLERDLFTRTLIRELSGLLQEMVGLEEASGYISVVGQRIGQEIDRQYKNAIHVDKLTKEQIADVLVDLKKRIQGDFYVIEASDDKVVMGNHLCPFGDKVKDRPSLCMMTSNVFGTIAADNNGYAKVSIDKTIAQGHDQCLVTVYFNTTEEAKQAEGREYFAASE